MNYSELQTAVIDWSARSDVSAFVPSAIEFATAMFNNGMGDIKALRARQMVTKTDLTPTSGVCTLPDDYLQYVRVVDTDSPRRPLQYITPDQVDHIYPFGEAGSANNFTIIGSQLRPYPVSTNDIELTYYQAIPDLSVSNATNWLLTKQPNLYLHGALLQVALYVKDNDMATRSGALVTSMLDGLNGSDSMSMFAGARSIARGVKP